MQISFSQWLVAQYQADFTRTEKALLDEADARQSCLDYEELDHELNQLESYVELAQSDWA